MAWQMKWHRGCKAPMWRLSAHLVKVELKKGSAFRCGRPANSQCSLTFDKSSSVTYCESCLEMKWMFLWELFKKRFSLNFDESETVRLHIKITVFTRLSWSSFLLLDEDCLFAGFGMKCTMQFFRFNVKGTVRPKMTNLLFAHPHVRPNLYDFLFSVEPKLRYFEEYW